MAHMIAINAINRVQCAHARILAVTSCTIVMGYEKLAVIVDMQSAQCTCCFIYYYNKSHSAEGLAPMVFIQLVFILVTTPFLLPSGQFMSFSNTVWHGLPIQFSTSVAMSMNIKRCILWVYVCIIIIVCLVEDLQIKF
jgi:hypothetical protein